MDMPKNLFKQNLLRVPPMVGTWIMSGGTTTAEALGCVGFDFLVIDMEHVPLDWERTYASLQAVAGTGASAVTRIPWNDTVAVKRALDIGAQTLMFPMIQNADEARRAVAATRYPPDGIRGIAAVHRGSRYGTVPGYLKNASAEICVICQIETPAAAARIEEIAAVPGVDALFVGPGDLSGAMGHLGDIAHPNVQAALAECAAKAKKLGKACGIVGPNPDMVGKFIAMGYSYVAVASDMGMMVSRATEFLGALRGQNAAPAKPTGPY
ncbi:MAG: 2-dehydro-3-deoxyglucarate aldolase [Telmatospirillum sp.]|nr:2-dehydro-3-deoxyglucarate aldolase [Telmatospirillum sp.]